MKRRSWNRSRTSSRDNTQQSAHAIMQVCFAVYLFLYFYLVQSDVLALLQHEFSNGTMTYNPLIGAIVLTLPLVGLQWLIVRAFNFREEIYALSFFPLALLAVLPSVLFPKILQGVFVMMVLLLAIWICIVVFGLKQRSRKKAGKTANPWGIHALWLFLIMLFMGICSGSHDTISYEVKTAQLLLHHEYDKAGKVGQQSLVTSSHLTALRAYALSHKDKGLGAKLFAYPLPPTGSESLLLRPSDSLHLLFAPDSLYAYLKTTRPQKGIKASDYFHKAAKSHPISAARDYWLCALLLDRDLEQFIAELPRYYNLSDSSTLSAIIPRYYAEAIVLYNRLTTQNKISYDDQNITANYRDFKEKEKNITNAECQRNLLWREYGDTYWWYYFYGAKK